MKVTWFAGDAFRVQIGGKIVVLNPASAIGVELRELVSGADMVIDGTAGLDSVDPLAWRPYRPASALFDESAADVRAYAIEAGGGLLISAPGEPPLLFLHRSPSRMGRWVRDAVVIPVDASPQQAIIAIIEILAPALVLVRDVDLPQIDFGLVAAAVDGTALQVLEGGMGVEFG